MTTSEPMRPEEPVTRSFTGESYGGLGWVWGRRDFQNYYAPNPLRGGASKGCKKVALLRSVSVNLAELRRAPRGGEGGGRAGGLRRPIERMAPHLEVAGD